MGPFKIYYWIYQVDLITTFTFISPELHISRILKS